MPKTDIANELIVLSGSEFRDQFSTIARTTLQSVLIESRGMPVAVYRPFSLEEEEAFLHNPFLPSVNLRSLTKEFGLKRRLIAEHGRQAAVCRVEPGGTDGTEIILGVITVLTPAQATQIRANPWDKNLPIQFAQLQKSLINPARTIRTSFRI